MKKFLAGLFILIAHFSQAQKYDYRWILGYPGVPLLAGNTEVIFSVNSADTIDFQRNVDMENSQTTISDSAGNLLFYSNGAKIYNRNDSIMLNGDSLNYGAYWNSEGGTDYNAIEEIIGLPTNNPSIWNVIHYYQEYDPFQDPSLYAWRLYQTQIDMSRDSGLGGVIFKNKVLVEDTLGTYSTACKHANGRDWWVLASKSSSNCLYTLLVTPDTIIHYPMQCLGHNYTSQDAGQAVFSPDGTKFAWLGGYDGINIYDFDRCSGQLSNPINFPFYIPIDSGIEGGISFSPNSRYLYFAQSIYIIQFDMKASNIIASADTVGKYISPPDSTTYPGYFFLMQLAPDGKIYVSSNNGIKYLHVVNDPDKKGDSCNFVNYGFPLPYCNSFGLPSYPVGYRLGPLVGSGCDTLTAISASVNNKEKDLKIYPNPASDYAIIDYGFTNWNNGQPTLEVCNVLGKTVYSKLLPMYSGFQRMDISRFAAGAYNVYIKRGAEIVAEGKIIKQ